MCVVMSGNECWQCTHGLCSTDAVSTSKRAFDDASESRILWMLVASVASRKTLPLPICASSSVCNSRACAPPSAR